MCVQVVIKSLKRASLLVNAYKMEVAETGSSRLLKWRVASLSLGLHFNSYKGTKWGENLINDHIASYTEKNVHTVRFSKILCQVRY